MEFVDGKTLKDFLKEKKPVPVEEAVSIAIQISDGLTDVHAQGVILRDLKPENVMLTHDRHGDMRVKLVDFGAVKLSSQTVEQADADLTRGMFIGTALYASPELSKGEPLDERSDIYGLGIILYEMLAGHPPFLPSGLPDLLYKHAYASPPPLENAPASLIRLVAQALSKDPKERPQSAAEFASRLRDFERPIELPSPTTAKAILIASPIVTRFGKSSLHLEGTGEDEETRLIAVTPVRNSHEPNLLFTQAEVARDKKVSPHRASQRIKAATKKVGRVASPKTSGSTAGGGLGHVTQEKVNSREGRAAATRTGKPKVGLGGGLRTLTAFILILSSLAVSIFLIWRLAQDISPDAMSVKASENPDKPALRSLSSEVGNELITKTDVNIRVRPSGKSKKIGLAEKMSRVRILAKHNNWREIIVLEHGREKEDTDSADQGWIDGDNLAIADDGG
jgi:serine/threonine protein kinase